MNNQTEGDTAAKARRRLIKGAFGAPAALTLVSGSVYAASNQRCLQSAQNPAVVAPTPATGTWLRVQLYTLVKVKADGSTRISTWVRGLDLADLKPPGTVYLASGSWQAVTAETGSGFSAGDLRTSTPTTNNGANSPQSSGQYVAVRVDSVGNIVGVQGVGAPGGAAVSLVCWASFTA